MSGSTKYEALFKELCDKMKNPDNGFFNANGIPYHATETVVVEAPSHGHESTSEAASFYVYLEAMNGVLTGDWTGLTAAWKALEFFVPTSQDAYADYNPGKPAEYAAEHDQPSGYPSVLDRSVRAGIDPLADKLSRKYGKTPVYSMHWLADPDNMWGFGTLFNTFQRGAHESVWGTIPQPCVDDKSHGGRNGYMDLFVEQDASPPAQWKYTVASDADARAIQAVFFAKWMCEKNGRAGPPEEVVANASKMGDWLTYTCYDKYFLKLGTQSKKEPGGTEEDAFHGLLSWYTAFGAPVQRQGWGFRIGCSHSHAGYQNPFAAYMLGQQAAVFPEKWKQSMMRQLQLYAWLQSAEGAIAGGVTNSWNGDYDDYPAGTPTFHDMAYVAHPVYLSPPSNSWSGMNAWGMERVLMYYYVSGDVRVENLVKDWCYWVAKHVKKTKQGAIVVPAVLEWTGQPASSWSSEGGFPQKSSTLHCMVAKYGRDIGVMACMARSLLLYSAVTKDGLCEKAAYALLNALIKFKDAKGYSLPEYRPDYENFDAKVYVPPGWKGTTPLGDAIDENSTFLSLRKSIFEKDAMYQEIRKQLNAKKIPKLRIHRFWAHAELAVTFAIASLVHESNVKMKIMEFVTDVHTTTCVNDDEVVEAYGDEVCDI